MKNILAIFSTIVLITTSSCELDLQQDPNALSPESASVEFVLNSVQFGIKDWYFEATEPSMEMVRMRAANPRADTYAGWKQPQDFDDLWELTYVTLLSDVHTLIGLAEEKELFMHAGMGRTLRAFVLMNMVDLFGDIPLTEAIDPDILEPSLDDGASIYAFVDQDLQTAITNFGQGGVAPTADIFYSGDADDWIALANTLRMRSEVTRKLVGGSGATVASLASTAITSGQDFVFAHSTVSAAPDSRHEYFIDNYIGGGSDYQSNYFMWLLTGETRPYDLPDPRTRYYFYRQADEHTTDVNEMNCVQETRPDHYPASHVWCQDFLPPGYWGRDHNDTDGIPPDNQLRTLFGVYPAGGRFDDDSFEPGDPETGLMGAGIHPLMMSFYVDFMMAEAIMTMGAPGDAASHLEAGIRGSIDYVMNFGSSVADEDLIPTNTQVNTYVSNVMAEFNDPDTNEDRRLDILSEQYLVALFGNGVEAMNYYRRTGRPSGIQLPLVSQPGDFTRSFWYPASAVNTNNNIEQKATLNNANVFWDTNPNALN
ncbi:MAG: SusD/RagB family nutrient-binding outer membrane lipoprotein [Cyclobacteriaceae bacterium]